jgi:PPOX class probable F420-dependent enzyme
VAVLATYRRDGSVLLSPVWHEWRDGGFNVQVYAGDVKEQHLRRDPRASIVVCDDGFPFRGLELRAEARLGDEEAHTMMLRIATRYLGPEAGRRYAEAAGGAEILVVRLEPGELRVWDFADEPALDRMESGVGAEETNGWT